MGKRDPNQAKAELLLSLVKPYTRAQFAPPAQTGEVTIVYTYNGDGQRVMTSDGTTTTVYIGNYFEWNVESGTLVKYYYAGAERIAMRTGTGSGTAGLVWLLGDHLGSTSLTVDAESGAKLSELRYKPWGALRYEWGVTETRYKFTGQAAEIGGLYFYGARFYDSSLNRFLSPDSIVPDPSNPLDWDRYSYTRNNPLRHTDPTGNWSEDQLEDWLGEDWEDYYFGEGGVFEGRDKLKEMLLGEATDILNLAVIKEFFQLASYLDTIGVSLGDYDAIGCRITALYGFGAFVGGNIDAVLNMKSGELSYFGAGEIGGGAGVTTSPGGAGYLLLKNLATNKEYQGPGKSLGSSLAHILGANVERSWGGEINGNKNVYSGLYAGITAGEGFAPLYETASYTFVEALNVNEGGYNFFAYLNLNPVKILSDWGDMLQNDILQ